MNLFPYQVEGADWLAEKRFGLLADEMGLGKSAQAIRAADDILAERILVICPAVARVNWLREFQKFAKYPRKFVIGLEGSHVPRPGEGYICSYELAIKTNLLQKWQGHFDLLILDEAHYLKSPDAQRTIQILAGAGKIKMVDGRSIGGVIRNSFRTWALTGTPMPNHPGELWVWATTFGVCKLDYASFCRRFCEFIPGFRHHLQITGLRKDRREELRALLAPVILRRTVKQVGLQLPELFFGDVVVEPGNVRLSAEQLDKATQEELWLRERLRGVEELDPKAMGLLEALARSVSTLRLYNGLQKIEPVAELLEVELSANHYPKIVVFAIHTEVIRSLAVALQEFGTAVIHGGVSPGARQAAIDAFQTNPKLRVMICNIHAAGTAITLTAADQVLFVESAWSPGDNQQAAKRCHRIGQTHTVRARFVAIADSIDEKVQRINRRKAQDIRAVLD